MRLKYNFLGKIHNNIILLSAVIAMKMANFAPPPPLSLPLSHEGREVIVRSCAKFFRQNSFCNSLKKEVDISNCGRRAKLNNRATLI